MRKKDYSDEQIIDAGRRLEKTGYTVNGWSLRKELGGGRPYRLADVWDAATQSTDIVETTTVDEVSDLPIEINEAVNLATSDLIQVIESAVVNCNTLAIHTANQTVADTLDKMRTDIANANETEVQAHAAIERCDETIAAHEDTIEHLNGIIAQMDKNLTQRDNRIEELDKKLSLSLILTNDLESDRDEANSDKTEAMTKVERLSAGKDLLSEQLSESYATNSMLMTENAGVAKANVILEAANIALIEDKDVAVAGHNAAELQLASIDGVLSATKQLSSDLAVEIKELRAEQEILKLQHKDDQHEIFELQDIREGLLGDLKKIALCNEQGGEITK